MVDFVPSASDVAAPILPPQETPEEINPYKGTKHKFKAHGKEIEVEYDELLSKASLAEGAQENFLAGKKALEQARIERKAIEDRLGKLSNAEAENWEEIIDFLGIDKALKFASTVNKTNAQWMELSEDERADLLYRSQADAAIQELEALKGKEKKEAQTQASQQAYAAINQEIGDALAEAKESGVPLADLPDIALQVVDEMLAVLEEIEKEEKAGRQWKGKPPSAKEVIARFGKQYDERSASYIKKLDAKKLKSMLSPEQLAELRQEELSQLYGGSTPNRMTKPSSEPFNMFTDEKQSAPKPRDSFAALDAKFGVKR